jgi:ribonuclease G
LQAFDVERLDEERMVGAIFKGKVQNLEPGLKGRFRKHWSGKKCFLTLLGYASRSEQ